MKFKKGLFGILAISLVLSGCGQKKETEKKEVTETINNDEYRMVVPYKSSDARQVHVEYNRGYADINAVGKGLLQYSKEFFSTDDYYLQDGQILDRDSLAIGTYYEDKTGLLGHKSKDNNYGLNPANNSKLAINDRKSITCSSKTIPVVDIFELDFYKNLGKKAPIKGVSFAIVLNPKVVDKHNKEYKMSDDQLLEYGKAAANDLIAYVKTLPQVNDDLEFCVSLFVADSSDQNLPGHFIGYGHGSDEINNFKRVKEQWILFPSDESEKKVGDVNNTFTHLSDLIRDFLPNDTGVVGKGKYYDGSLKELSIEVSAQVKSYSECVALCQFLKQEISKFDNTGYTIVVDVKNNSDTFAMIERKANSNDVTIILK